jgi:hypothetical protein
MSSNVRPLVSGIIPRPKSAAQTQTTVNVQKAPAADPIVRSDQAMSIGKSCAQL